MRLFRPWFFIRYLYAEALFRIETSEMILCLTFDDGPDPESTPELLDILGAFKVKAIFFCDGRKAEMYPSLVARIVEAGHLIGNHGYNHLNGWISGTAEYCKDIFFASQFTSDRLFRPPYGRLRLNQYFQLRRQFRIVFWDVMPYDFDVNYGPEKSLGILLKKIRRGSIIVLHDKPGSSSLQMLPEFLKFTDTMEYRFVLPGFF